VIGQLNDIRLSYEKNLQSQYGHLTDQPVDLTGLYGELTTLLTDFLKQYLNVEPIPCERGDDFDDRKHKPIFVEPDERLAEGKIKAVMNPGFQTIDGDAKSIVKHVEVIVVKNESAS
jgi:molecular chaperone GrpE (heat shock protein)